MQTDTRTLGQRIPRTTTDSGLQECPRLRYSLADAQELSAVVATRLSAPTSDVIKI
jgi:hypothetical protein